MVVAVLDTGTLPHPDLSGKLLAGYDFISSTTISNDNDGRDSDATDAGDNVPRASSAWQFHADDGSHPPTAGTARAWRACSAP